MHHVHVIGCRRSGTTLMMELLWNSYNFKERCTHEASVFNINPIQHDETLYLSKKPADTTKIQEIFLANEQLFLIGISRDPRAVVTSIHPSKNEVYFADFYKWNSCEEALQVLEGHPRFLLIRYENLLSNPQEEQNRITRHFGFLESKRDFVKYPHGSNPSYRAIRSLGGARTLDKSRIKSWVNHLPRVKGQLLLHPDMNRALIKNGYEKDKSWTKQLEGVDPYYQKYKDGAPSFLRATETKIRFKYKTRKYLKDLAINSTSVDRIKS